MRAGCHRAGADPADNAKLHFGRCARLPAAAKARSLSATAGMPGIQLLHGGRRARGQAQPGRTRWTGSSPARSARSQPLVPDLRQDRAPRTPPPVVSHQPARRKGGDAGTYAAAGTGAITRRQQRLCSSPGGAFAFASHPAGDGDCSAGGAGEPERSSGGYTRSAGTWSQECREMRRRAVHRKYGVPDPGSGRCSLARIESARSGSVPSIRTLLPEFTFAVYFCAWFRSMVHWNHYHQFHAHEVAHATS